MNYTTLFFCLTLLVSHKADAQKATFYSTNYKQECWWNADTKKYDKCTGGSESSLFKLNGEQTMFHHTTEKISSDYYVTKREYDKENDVTTYDVKSDVGNTYFFIVDTKDNQLRILGNNKTSENKTYMHIFTIKQSWTE